MGWIERWGFWCGLMLWLLAAETGEGVVVDLLGAGLELKEVPPGYRDLELDMVVEDVQVGEQ